VTHRRQTTLLYLAAAAVLWLTGLSVAIGSRRPSSTSEPVAHKPTMSGAPGSAGHGSSRSRTPPVFSDRSDTELVEWFQHLEATGPSMDRINQMSEIVVTLGERGKWLKAIDLIEAFPGEGSDREGLARELLGRCKIPSGDLRSLLPDRHDPFVRKAFVETLIVRDPDSDGLASRTVCDFLHATSGRPPVRVEGSASFDFSGPASSRDRSGVIEAVSADIDRRLGLYLPSSPTEAVSLRDSVLPWLDSLPTLTPEEKGPMLSALSRYTAGQLPFDTWELNLPNATPDGNFCEIAASGMLQTDPARAAGELERITPTLADAIYSTLDENAKTSGESSSPALSAERCDALAKQLFNVFLARGDSGRATLWLPFIVDPAERTAAEARLLKAPAPR
jgi:hypothetical protein